MYDISGPEEFVLGRTTRVEDVWTGVWRVQRVRGEVDFSWKNIESFSEGGGGGEVDFVGVEAKERGVGESLPALERVARLEVLLLRRVRRTSLHSRKIIPKGNTAFLPIAVVFAYLIRGGAQTTTPLAEGLAEGVADLAGTPTEVVVARVISVVKAVVEIRVVIRL